MDVNEAKEVMIPQSMCPRLPIREIGVGIYVIKTFSSPLGLIKLKTI